MNQGRFPVGPSSTVFPTSIPGRRPAAGAGRGRLISRRHALTLLGASAGSLVVAGCGNAETIPSELAYTSEDFAGAQLSAIMRKAFLPEIDDLTEAQGQEWAAGANASITFSPRDDWREAYTEVAEARKGEDIAELFGNGPHLFSDRLVDVSDLVEEIGMTSGGWISAARDAAEVDGVWRAVPWAYTALAINYRESFLREVGAAAPETYDDLLEIATRLRDNNLPRAGFSMSHGGPNDSANLAYSMLWSFGGHEVDETGTMVAIDSTGTRDALEFYRELVAVSDPGALRFSEAGNNDAFLNGQIAMTQNAYSIYMRALNEFPDVAADMNHIRYPSGPNGSHQLVEVNALGIFEHCQNVDAAKNWIRFATQPEQLRMRATTSFSIYNPPLVQFLDDPAMLWNSDPKMLGMKGAEHGGHMAGWPGPSTKEAGLVYENGSIIKMFMSVGNGTETVDGAIRVATGELKRVYET